MAGPLKPIGKPEVETVPDPTLHVGEKVVEDAGRARAVGPVTRTVYEGDEVLYEETWYTEYHSEPKIVRVGTIPVRGAAASAAASAARASAAASSSRAAPAASASRTSAAAAPAAASPEAARRAR